jgi:hypothetical protein
MVTTWQYGIRSSGNSGTLYGGFIHVKLPAWLPILPNCPTIYGIFASMSTTTNYFYQTFIGYVKNVNKWVVSGGSTNPNCPCDLGCGPYPNSSNPYVIQPGHTYELGVKKVTPNVICYFIDVTSGSPTYNIHVLADGGNMTGSVGGIVESDDQNTSDLSMIGLNNSLEIVHANWFTAPGMSTQWTHAIVYATTSELPVPSGETMKLISAGDVKIGYQIPSGTHYNNNAQIW